MFDWQVKRRGWNTCMRTTCSSRSPATRHASAPAHSRSSTSWRTWRSMGMELQVGEFYQSKKFKNRNKQECISVVCVPAARWPYAGVCFPGGCLLRGVCSQGVSASRGVSGPGGAFLRWVSCPEGGGLPWGGSGPGCVCSWGGDAIPACTEGMSAPRGGVWSWGVCYPSMHWGRHPPPPWTEWQTRVKTLPWPQLRCGR